MKIPHRIMFFDAGGTLIRREPSDDQVFGQRLQNIGLETDLPNIHTAMKLSEVWIGEQIMREIHGAPRMPDGEFMRKVDEIALRTVFRQAADEEIAAWLDHLQAMPKVEQSWKPLPGSLETLAALHSMGIRMAVVSNFNKTLPDLLGHVGLAGYFETIVCSALVGIEKPNPEIMHTACQRLEVHPAQVLYIGDHPLDVLCAKQAGMSVAWLREPGDVLPPSIGCQADFELCNLTELLTLIPAGRL